MSNKPYRVAISGVQGYIGRELMQLVLAHPELELAAVHARHDQDSLYQQMPLLSEFKIPVYSLEALIKHATTLDLVFLATPTEVSIEVASALFSTGVKLIDLSGAFRLPETQFNQWYGLPHAAADLIPKACYGLSPWANAQAKSQLIANPGCYASCALMTLLPLIEADLIQEDDILIDAKSGVSGSGKQTNPDLMFCEIANNFFPYKIGKHQHLPEIQRALYLMGGRKTELRMTTSILPLIRGIAMSVYTKAKASAASDEALASAVTDAFHQAYKAYPLVRYQEIGKRSAAEDQWILHLKNVVQTPNCHIGYFVQNGQITLFSSIDNLMKGAASQAIENLNALFGLPLTTGLVKTVEGGLR